MPFFFSELNQVNRLLEHMSTDSGSRSIRKAEESAYCYEGLSEGLVRLLQRTGWSNPILLHTALTSRQETFDLLRELTAGRESEQQNEFWEVELWQWSQQASGRVQRAKGRLAGMSSVERSEERALAQRDAIRKDTMQHIQKTILAVCKNQHWRIRKGQGLEKPESQQGRAQLEETERVKWVDRVVSILVEAELPVVFQANLTRDPVRALARAVGSKRSRTLRSRVRTWNRIRLWLTCVHQCPWPKSVAHMLDYLDDLSRGGCGKSVAGNVAATLSFFEETGGVSRAEKISASSLFMNSVNVITMQAQLGNTGTKKAPSLFISILISLELYVVDTSRSRYKRGLAWLRLIRNWTAMRFDDMMGIDPPRMSLSSQCWRAVLTRTKTSGAGMKILELPVFCHARSG